MKYLENILSQKEKKESGMEPVTVTIVGTEVYYGVGI